MSIKDWIIGIAGTLLVIVLVVILVEAIVSVVSIVLQTICLVDVEIADILATFLVLAVIGLNIRWS
jgi:hypothetical protein